MNSFFSLHHDVASVLHHTALVHDVLLQSLLHVLHLVLRDDLLVVEQVLEGIVSLSQHVRGAVDVTTHHA